ncbi:MAG TPA: carboxypeptidase-like regulatory domain-containing protein [Thermoanaerobaculia bacterium]
MPALLAILLAAVTSSYRLVDSTGEPVRGATVRVVGGVSSAVTDDEGRFRLDPELPPPFELAVFSAHGAVLAASARSGQNLKRRQPRKHDYFWL